MNILIAASSLKRDKHEVLVQTATGVKGAVDKADLSFVSFHPEVDRDITQLGPLFFSERAKIAPGPEQIRYDYEHYFVKYFSAKRWA
jgi:hypothetical protein